MTDDHITRCHLCATWIVSGAMCGTCARVIARGAA